jgi:hypothetical protein
VLFSFDLIGIEVNDLEWWGQSFNGAQWNKETIEDLLSLGFADIANLLNTLFPNNTPPINIDKETR